jgi:hypothetical protein
MTTTTTTDNKSIGSQYLAKYIRNVQKANEATAVRYLSSGMDSGVPAAAVGSGQIPETQ